jgi:hypothetical protein
MTPTEVAGMKQRIRNAIDKLNLNRSCRIEWDDASNIATLTFPADKATLPLEQMMNALERANEEKESLFVFDTLKDAGGF